MNYRILVTGSRDWPDRESVWEELNRQVRILGSIEVVIIHGDCPTGADRFAAEWARVQFVAEEPHPANWDTYGKAAGPVRNQQMVERGADICLAFPLVQSRGTRDCMRRARAAGIPVVVRQPS